MKTKYSYFCEITLTKVYSFYLAAATFLMICAFEPGILAQGRGPQSVESAILEGPGLPPFKASESLGVFVGVEKFPNDASIPDAAYAVDDAIDLAHLFAFELKLIPAHRIYLSISGEPRKPATKGRLEELQQAQVLERSATRCDLLNIAKALREEVGPGGLLVVSISTHGFNENGSHLVLTKGSRKVPIQSPVAKNQKSSRAKLISSFEEAVPVNLFLDSMTASSSKRGLILVDTCRHRISKDFEATNYRGIDPALEIALSKSSGFTRLAAARPGGDSYAKDGNGIFTRAIIDGLKCGATADPKGFIRVKALASYVDESVTAFLKDKSRYLGGSAHGIVRTFLDRGSEELPLVACTALEKL